MKNLYLLGISLLLVVALNAQVPENEFQALKSFYNATNGDSWSNRSGWENINTTATKDSVTNSWFGISIQEGHVVGINFYSNNLSGVIPDAIGDMKYLNQLTLSGNKINGPLPTRLKELGRMAYFSVGGCPINSPFPSEIVQNWPLLRDLTVYYCGLTGSLPDTIFKNMLLLERLWIYGNQLEGKIPTSVNNLSNLSDFNCGGNKFDGPLPTLDSSLLIYRIDLSNNNFTGSIPVGYGKLTNLQGLVLRNNSLSGIIPEGFFTSNFYNLYIDNNYFTFDGIEKIYPKTDTIEKTFDTYKKFPLLSKDISVKEGEPLLLNATALSKYALGGSNNRYKWYCNNVAIDSSASPIYIVENATASNVGSYRFEVTNTVVPNLTLTSENIVVTIEKVNHAPTDILLSKSIVDENYSGVVATLSVTDSDGDSQIFSLVNGDKANDNQLFTISGNQLLLKNIVDYELVKSLNVLIMANDGKGGSLTKTFTVSVNNVNEKPLFYETVFSGSIQESAPKGTPILTFSATDPENDILKFSISKGNEGNAFSLIGNKLVVADSSKIDFETQKSFSLTATVSDGKLSSDTTVTISVVDVNFVPTIENATFSIVEKASVGTAVGTIVAKDIEGDVLTFSILSGNESAAFKIEGSAIVVANAEKVDYKTTPVFNLNINVSDGVNNAQSAVTINLFEMNMQKGNDILSASVPFMIGEPIIDIKSHTVNFKVGDVHVGSLLLRFDLSPEAISSPVSGTELDFTSPQTITVISQSGDSCIWTVNVEVQTTINSESFKRVEVYPNPATDFVSLSGLEKGSSIKLISLTGSLVMSNIAQRCNEELSLHGVEKGVYFIVIESNSIVVSKKQIIK